MDEDDIPDISNASTGEACTVILVIAAILSAMASMGPSATDPSSGFAAFGITAGLAAIAIAILTVGRNINRDD